MSATTPRRSPPAPVKGASTDVGPRSPGEPLVGPKALAAQLDVPVSWVYANAEAGTLPHFKLGKYLRFRPAEVAAWLEARRRANGSGRPA